MFRIFADAPRFLHEIKVLQEIVVYKKDEKEEVAARQLQADERKEDERLKRVQDAKDNLAMKEGRRRYRPGQGPAFPPAGPPPIQPGPPIQPTGSAAPPVNLQQLFQQLNLGAAAQTPLQQEMRQFFQQLAGVQPFVPVQSTPPIAVDEPQRVVAPAAEPLAAFPFVVKEEQPGMWSAKFVPDERKTSPKRPAAMALDDDEDDGSDLGEEGGAADLLDKAQLEDEDRQEARQKKPFKKYRRARKPISPRLDGHPDRRQRIHVVDEPELDEKHDAPLPPSRSEPVAVPQPPDVEPLPYVPHVPADVTVHLPQDAMEVEPPKKGPIARFFTFGR